MNAAPPLDAFRREFMQAAVAHERRRRHRVRLATPLVAAAALAACGAGLTVVLGDPVPAPPAGDLPRSQAPLPGTARIEVREDDPGGGLPWAVRVADSASGLTCVALGRVAEGRFGRVDTGDRLHELPLRGSGGCVDLGAETIVPVVRQLDSIDGSGPRTVVYGLTSDRVERLRLQTPAGERELAPSDRGAFLVVIDGAIPTAELRLRASLRGGGRAEYLGSDQGRIK